MLVCLFVECPQNITNITNGDRNVTASQASYGCNVGYTLYGDAQLFCLLNGTWDTKPPICNVTGSSF